MQSFTTPDTVGPISKKSEEFQVQFVLKENSTFSDTSVKPLSPLSTSTRKHTSTGWVGRKHGRTGSLTCPQPAPPSYRGGPTKERLTRCPSPPQKP